MLIFDNKHYTHSNVNTIINIIHTVMLIFDNKHYTITHSNVNIR